MPYKDPEKRRAFAREWAKKWRKAHPEKHKASRTKWRTTHYEKFLEIKRNFYHRHRVDLLEKYKLSYQAKRFAVLQHYGGRCSCCGENTYEFLTIEHKNGGGTKHRKQIGASNMVAFIIKNNYPDNFDVLCYNCNCAKAFNKICPHKIAQIGE